MYLPAVTAGSNLGIICGLGKWPGCDTDAAIGQDLNFIAESAMRSQIFSLSSHFRGEIIDCRNEKA